jgi:hypothetical protein
MIMKKIISFPNIFKAPLPFFPLTTRGILALAISSFCLFFLAKEYSDLIASILGTSLLIMVTLTTILLLVSAPFLKKKMSIVNHDSTQKLFSRTTNPCGFSISRLRILPFFYLSIKRNIPDKEVRHQTHVFTGITTYQGKNSIITDSIWYPHRGLFQIKGYTVEYGDIFGLTRRIWSCGSEITHKVAPPPVTISPLPIMAASAQIGDTETAKHTRSGDLFDVRSYRPGDSLKRILWKVYARSGDLVVREPEPAIIPEGEVAIYVLAQKREDLVASSALSYLQILDRQNILFRVGFLGEGSSLALTSEEAEQTAIEAAGREKYPSDPLKDDFSAFLNSLKKSGQSPYQIVIFLSDNLPKGVAGNDLSETELLDGQNHISRIEKEAEANGLQLYFALVPNTEETLHGTTSLTPLKMVRKIRTSFGKKVQGEEKLHTYALQTHPVIKVSIDSMPY